MKKQIGYLLLALCILSVNKVFADPLGTVLPAQVQAEMGGYNPGAFNTTEMQNINRFQIDKSYIQSFDEVTKDELNKLKSIAIDKVVNQLGTESVNILADAFGDITEYIGDLVSSKVYELKNLNSASIQAWLQAKILHIIRREFYGIAEPNSR